MCFYRVEDEDSRRRIAPGSGFYAPGESEVGFENGWELVAHLDWRNREPTSFISVYSRKDVALREAHRRKRQGKRDVTVTEIDVSLAPWRLEFRNMRRLCASLEVYIETEAWHNSEYEWVFLHCIPKRAIRDWWFV
ncbi:hypothetical protein RB601_003617 [Gaeumannomyces tritici]